MLNVLSQCDISLIVFVAMFFIVFQHKEKHDSGDKTIVTVRNIRTAVS